VARVARSIDLSQVGAGRFALGLLVALGVLARAWLLLRSRGSNDIVLWELFAFNTREHSLAHCYENIRLFNHPPLMGYWAYLAFSAGKLLGIRFDVLFKLAPMAAEIATAVLLYRIWQDSSRRGLQAVVALTFSLASLLIGTYHGNTDLILAFFCLLAAYLLDQKRPLAAGLALAAALNVKILPILLIPLFALQCRSWRDLRRLVAGLSVGAIPFIAFFVITPAAFFRNVFGYQAPVPLGWGLYTLIRTSNEVRNMPRGMGALLRGLWSYGRYLVVAAALALAVVGRVRRELTARELTAAALASFLILSPGFGVQYLVWCLPLFLSLDLARSLVYSTVAGICLVLFYLQYWTHAKLIESNAAGPTSVAFALVGMIVWTLLWTWIVWILRRRPTPASSLKFG
jgi:hypothetical protein